MTPSGSPGAPWLQPLIAAMDKLLVSPWLLVCIAAYLLVGLGGIPLFDLDEGAFSSATMEMLQRGDYITTYMGGTLRFDKPILIYWLQALSVAGLGLNEFALRLPSVICGSLWCWALFVFARQQLDTSRAGTAVLLFACCFVFSIIARAATADALLNLLLTLAILDSYRSLTQPDHPKLRLLRWRAYLWVGLGVLAKGPIAILVPVVVATLFVVLTGYWRAWAALMLNPVGWMVAAAMFVPWYVAEYMAQGQLFIDGFFMKHNVSRFTSTLEGHGGYWYYYLPVSLLVFMPATGFFLQLVVFAKRFSGDPLDKFCWCWFVFVLVFFSFSNTQLPHYLLYGIPPMFILMARYREQIKGMVWVIVPVVVFLGAFLALPEIAQHALTRPQKPDVAAAITAGLPYMGINYRVSIALALAAVIGVSFLSSLPVWRRQLLISIIFTLIFVHQILPTYGLIQQQPIRAAATFAKDNHLSPVMWLQNTPSFSVYLGKVVPIRAPLPGEVVFTNLNKIHELPDADVLYNHGGVVLAMLKPLMAETSSPVEKP